MEIKQGGGTGTDPSIAGTFSAGHAHRGEDVRRACPERREAPFKIFMM